MQVNRFVLTGAFAAVAAYLCLHSPRPHPLHGVITAVFAVASLALLAEQRSHVEPSEAMLVREWRFLGCVRVFSRGQRLDQFDAVITKRVSDWEAIVPTRSTVCVGLRRRNGRLTAISWFYATPGEQSAAALATARELSARTNLPLIEDLSPTI